jgi:hypothetical protein
VRHRSILPPTSSRETRTAERGIDYNHLKTIAHGEVDGQAGTFREPDEERARPSTNIEVA